MGEALALAEKCGIDRSDFMNMFSQTIFACNIYQNDGRLIAEKRFAPGGLEMRLALKDNNLVRDAAEQAQVPMPLANLNHDRLMASIARGRSKIDWIALTQLINEDAGL